MTKYLKALRPEQWIKSGFCLAALFFSGGAFSGEEWLQVVPIVVAFSIVASAGYVMNDLLNRKEDRAHPRKKDRMIASGKVPASHAVGLVLLCLALAFGISTLSYRLSWTTGCLGAYLGVNLVYTLVLRKVPIFDVASISLGFVLRVAAGAFALGLFPSEWLMVITYLLALLLGLGKRAGELVNLQVKGVDVGATRSCLIWYQKVGLPYLIWGLVGLLTLTYGIYCYKVQGSSPVFGVTCFPVAVALCSYAWDATNSAVTERPEKMVLNRPIIGICLIAWVIMVVSFI